MPTGVSRRGTPCTTLEEHPFPKTVELVSVCLVIETIARLDRLTERTSRSRELYLRAAIRALTALEETYWAQQATVYKESVIDRQFRTIMDPALHSEDPDHGLPHNQD